MDFPHQPLSKSYLEPTLEPFGVAPSGRKDLSRPRFTSLSSRAGGGGGAKLLGASLGDGGGGALGGRGEVVELGETCRGPSLRGAGAPGRAVEAPSAPARRRPCASCSPQGATRLRWARGLLLQCAVHVLRGSTGG